MVIDMAGRDLYGDVAEKLRAAESIAVLVHNSIDGDTLGSALALVLALAKLGKKAVVLAEEKIPENLSMLPCGDYVRQYGEGAGDGDAGEDAGGGCDVAGGAGESDAGGAPAEVGAADAGPWDVLVVVDAGDPGRLGRRARLLESGACVINIDHHITNRGYGDINLIISDAAATAELVYHLICRLGVAMDRDIAVCIYTGICTDTGGFSYNNTTSGCHEIAAEMLRFDLDVNKLHYLFFNAITCGKLRCHGYVANSLKFHYSGRLAVVVISDSALEALGATEADCEGLVDIGRNVRGVEVSAMARETKPGEFRINLRSRNDADVSIMAKRFGGGGHVAASGCTICARAEDMEGLIVEAMAYAFD
ncbi:MAG: DHH family phosphoesterase [Clostridiales bacterium]|jgi:phosphoesterase RecJ-like protein|nr:DHH family phosphoesterase [Clostridiales bacterium]